MSNLHFIHINDSKNAEGQTCYKFNSCDKAKQVIRIPRMAGKIKEFVMANVIETITYGANFNGYGWADHIFRYLLTPAKAKELHALIDGKKAAEKAVKHLVEPEYNEQRLACPEWQTLIARVEDVNNKHEEPFVIVYNDYKQKHIQTPEWTQQQMEELGARIEAANDYEEVWACWIELCKLNASAHKGYRALSSHQEKYNSIVYDMKGTYIDHLADKWVSMGGLLQYYDGVVYITNRNGWQVSFHRPNQHTISIAERCYTDIWCHITCSWCFDNVDDYKKEVEEWNRKQKIENDSRLELNTYNEEIESTIDEIVLFLMKDKAIKRYYAERGYNSMFAVSPTEAVRQKLKKTRDYLVHRFTPLESGKKNGGRYVRPAVGTSYLRCS